MMFGCGGTKQSNDTEKVDFNHAEQNDVLEAHGDKKKVDHAQADQNDIIKGLSDTETVKVSIGT